jgi:CheY-like chemotaxis protein
MASRRQRILNIALNAEMQRTRAAILSSAGYEVVPAVNLLEVESQCKKHRGFDLVMVGYAMHKGEKHRAMQVVRKYCGAAPILELFQPGSEPADELTDELLPSRDEADALLAKVREILGKPRKRRAARAE